MVNSLLVVAVIGLFVVVGILLVVVVVLVSMINIRILVLINHFVFSTMKREEVV